MVHGLELQSSMVPMPLPVPIPSTKQEATIDSSSGIKAIVCTQTLAVGQRDTVTDMHTTVHAPWTKDQTLIFGPKNQRAIILNGHDPNRVANIENLYTCAVAEHTLTRLRTKKFWSPKIGSNDLELGRSVELSSTGTEWNARGFAY